MNRSKCYEPRRTQRRVDVQPSDRQKLEFEAIETRAKRTAVFPNRFADQRLSPTDYHLHVQSHRVAHELPRPSESKYRPSLGHFILILLRLRAVREGGRGRQRERQREGGSEERGGGRAGEDTIKATR